MGGGTGALALPYLIRPRPSWAQSNVLNVTTYDKFLPQEFWTSSRRTAESKSTFASPMTRASSIICLPPKAPIPPQIWSQWLATAIRSSSARTCSRRSTPARSQLEEPQPSISERPWAEVDGKLWGLPILAGYEGLAVNTNYVKDPQSWEVMFDPQYKGLTSYIVSDFMTITMQYLGFDGDFVSYTDKPEEAQKANQRGARSPDQAQGHGAEIL